MRSVHPVARAVPPFLALLCTLASAPATAAVERPFPLLTVSGEGSVAVVPDVAVTTAGVVTEAKTPREAADANARLTTAVLAAARQAGIAERDLRTARFSLAPVHAQRREGAPPQIGGYRAANSVTLRIRDTDRIPDVLEAVIAAGATNVSGLEFTVSEPSHLADDARRAAIADARRKAELYAQAAGAQVGRAVSITESETDGLRPGALLRAADAAQGSGPPVAAGEQTLRVQLTVSFELNY